MAKTKWKPPPSPLSTIRTFLSNVEEDLKEVRLELKRNEDKVKQAEAEVKRLQAQTESIKERQADIEKQHKQWLDTIDKLEHGQDAKSRAVEGKHAVGRDEDEGSSEVTVRMQTPKPATLKRSSIRASPTKRQRIVTPGSPNSPPPSSIPFSASGTNDPKDVYLANATTVIKDPAGDNIEIWCGICGGNTNTGSDTLLIGWKGMYEHIIDEHAEEPKARPRISESAFELVYRLSRHRTVTEEEAEAIEAGKHVIELAVPRKKQEEAIPIRTPTKQDGSRTSGVGGTGKTSRIKKVECHNCLTKFRASEPHAKCRYCALMACSLPACQDDIESAVGHDECGREPEEQSVDDFEWLNSD